MDIIIKSNYEISVYYHSSCDFDHRHWRDIGDTTLCKARAFNFTYRYIDDILSINNSRFAEFLPPLLYPPELEVKETTDTASSASFLDLYLEFDDSGQLSTKIYDKWDDFNFKIINFPNMCSNIPASPAYGVYISQLIRYARASSNYSDFLKRHLYLRNRLLDQGYKKIRLIRSLKKFFLSMCDVKLFLTFTFVVKILHWVVGDTIDVPPSSLTALTTILPILFQYCYKYCYSDSRNL